MAKLTITSAIASFLLTITAINGEVTIYKQKPLVEPTLTETADAASYTGAAAYDPTVLNPPALPDPPPAMAFSIGLQNGGTMGASILQPSSFFGFSVEMSVSNQILGKNSSYIQVPFLNLMSNLVKRAGEVRVRVGGNTQETAKLVDTLPDGKMLAKDIENASNPTQTPPLDYTRDLFTIMSAISDLVNVRWFLGIPFFDTNPFDLSLSQASRAILGDKLLGLQAGNEPDLYSRHGHRNSDYAPQNYYDEVGSLIAAMGDDARNILIGPNLANAEWQPQQIWDTGFVDSYSDSLAFLSFERYPNDNCFAQFGIGHFNDPQETFPEYLTHKSGQELASQYLEATAYAQTKGKAVIMFETNTASCGGFPGISDSFGAALWGLDYALQLAHSNFSGALFHIGGQNVYYNPFTPPPTNQSAFRQWTVGPIYYSALAMTEALGRGNNAQVLDLNANDGNEFTPAYAIFEDGEPTRVALFNYLTDPSGGSTYTASIAVAGLTSVKVKYLSADSVSQKGGFRWAGQTFGNHFESDGRLMGDEDVREVQCSDGVCPIEVPAPSFALVLLKGDEVVSEPAATFATTAVTGGGNTATVDEKVLETSNGHSGWDGIGMRSTSRGSVDAAVGRVDVTIGFGLTVVSMICAALVLI
ncbi:glycoside hydrolase family 79 protein [Cylindrobasidium torrendii FP15055 ss-10]|uniref:Glycoside hydrolase family 79 protein n=1 Tax=Cylindrobasidium torrendii FP15055 ss-10 TaxID=1314674 RepID=A0A0D7B381_9AGAR|nr:glycoside hydrolase family 79 protein [Cylindrobasidium torrendii FP15055 ss-10]